MKAICIKCHAEDALVTMDLDGSNLFRCNECSEEFTCEEVREYIATVQNTWGKILAWAESYPKAEAK